MFCVSVTKRNNFWNWSSKTLPPANMKLAAISTRGDITSPKCVCFCHWQSLIVILSVGQHYRKDPYRIIKHFSLTYLLDLVCYYCLPDSATVSGTRLLLEQDSGCCTWPAWFGSIELKFVSPLSVVHLGRCEYSNRTWVCTKTTGGRPSWRGGLRFLM